MTARSLDLARKSVSGLQVNLFLYHLVPSAARRNQDPPGVRPGDKAAAPALLPLRLSYLLTAYGNDEDNEQAAQEVLGRVMLAYHNNAILPRTGKFPDTTELQNVILSGLDKQIESVRLTLQPLSLDELSKLYGLQTNLRLTVAYEASVVLIDNGLPAVSALPAVSRSHDPLGAATDPGFPAGVFKDLPTLDEVRFPLGQAGFRAGDTVRFLGRGLIQESMCLEIRHASFPQPMIATVKPSASKRADTELICRIPDDLAGVASAAASWPAGVYFIAGATQSDGHHFTSPPVICPLLPRIVVGTPGEPAQPTITLDAAGKPSLRLLVQPAPLPNQQVQLLLGGNLIAVNLDNPVVLVGDHVTFPLEGQPFTSGDWVRLRIDGVDSSLLVLPVDPLQPERKFDPHLRAGRAAGRSAMTPVFSWAKAEAHYLATAVTWIRAARKQVGKRRGAARRTRGVGKAAGDSRRSGGARVCRRRRCSCLPGVSS